MLASFVASCPSGGALIDCNGGELPLASSESHLSDMSSVFPGLETPETSNLLRCIITAVIRINTISACLLIVTHLKALRDEEASERPECNTQEGMGGGWGYKGRSSLQTVSHNTFQMPPNRKAGKTTACQILKAKFDGLFQIQSFSLGLYKILYNLRG